MVKKSVIIRLKTKKQRSLMTNLPKIEVVHAGEGVGVRRRERTENSDKKKKIKERCIDQEALNQANPIWN